MIIKLNNYVFYRNNVLIFESGLFMTSNGNEELNSGLESKSLQERRLNQDQDLVNDSRCNNSWPMRFTDQRRKF